MGNLVLVVVLVLILGGCVRLYLGLLDQERVKRYIEERGGKLVSSRWSPLGPGWFGEKSDRIYEVRYLDDTGAEHLAHCKTSMWTGVYFTEDRVTRAAEKSSSPGA